MFVSHNRVNIELVPPGCYSGHKPDKLVDCNQAEFQDLVKK